MLAVALMASQSNAQDGKKKKDKRGGRNVAAQFLGRFKGVGLTDEQESKMKDVLKKFVGKLQELRKESAGLLSKELRKARSEAMKAAREAGLKGKAIMEAVNKKAPVPEAVAAKMKEVQAKMAAVQKEIRAALENVLTDEQKAKLPKRGGNKGNKGKKGKGKKKKKDDQ